MGRQAAIPRVDVGDVLVVDEADYCYGVGQLVMRVTAIGTPRGQVDGLEWLGVTGVEIRWNGAEGGQRAVLVRAAALAEALRAGRRRDPGAAERHPSGGSTHI